ncbi:hypothetical protein LXA43DRAFT_1022571, partial [Ganoderma leucocontextum]
SYFTAPGEAGRHPCHYDDVIDGMYYSYMDPDYIPPACLSPPPPPTTIKQTKIPHFFDGWRPKLPNLPLDVLLEISSHMHPLDLLNCCRTSKAFRSALLSRGSRSLWITILRSIPDFPPCPEDMSEPAYVALVFDDHCFSCAAAKAYYVDYVLRIRLCDECWGKFVCPGTDLLEDIPEAVCDVVTMLVPSFEFECSVVEDGRSWAHHLHPVSHVHEDLYYRPELEKMIHFCWPPPSPADLATLRSALLQRVEYIVQRHIHAVRLYWWIDLATTCMSSLGEQIARDHARVMEDIQGEKYLLPYEPPADPGHANLVQGKHYDPDIYARADLVRSCGAISHIQYYKERDRREECDNAVRAACLDARRAEFRGWYQHMVDNYAADYDRRMLPNRCDGGSIFHMLVWENEGRVPIDEATFYGFVGDNVPALLEQNIRNTMRQLAALVPYDWRMISGVRLQRVDGARGVGGGADMRTLARPDALFVCKECGARALPWPEIHGHWCERHPEESFWGRKLLGLPGERPKARLWKDGREVARAILDEIGLKTGTERARMDRLVRTGRLYCACGDPALPPPEDLTWAKLVHHVWMHWEMSRVRLVPQLDHDHSLDECIKLLPKDEDTTPASFRRRADSETRVKIQAVLSKRLEGSSVICSICDKLLEESNGGRKDTTLIIPNSVDAIAYHMEVKHGRPFGDGDISFYIFPGRTDQYS